MKKTGCYGALAMVVAFALYCYKCAVDGKLAKSADIGDFPGVWSGVFKMQGNSGKPAETRLEISGLSVAFSHLPVRDPQQNVTWINGRASIEFHATWAVDAPCIVLDGGAGTAANLPIYVYADKRRLFYPISPGRGFYMEFEKQKTQTP